MQYAYDTPPHCAVRLVWALEKRRLESGRHNAEVHLLLLQSLRVCCMLLAIAGFKKMLASISSLDGSGCRATDAELEDWSSGMLVKVIGGGWKAGWPAITRC